MNFHADAVRKKLMTDSATGAYKRRAEGRELQGCKDDFGEARRSTTTAECKLTGSEAGKGNKGKPYRPHYINALRSKSVW